MYLRILSYHDIFYQLCLITSEDSKLGQDCMISLNAIHPDFRLTLKFSDIWKKLKVNS